jgi:hypothetical protein
MRLCAGGMMVQARQTVAIDPMNGMITSYLASKKGQEMIRSYMSSPEGQKMIGDYIATPQGKKTLLQALPCIVESLQLSPEIQAAVAQKLEERS